MSDEYVSRKEHEKFCIRIINENAQLNDRLLLLEKRVNKINGLKECLLCQRPIAQLSDLGINEGGYSLLLGTEICPECAKIIQDAITYCQKDVKFSSFAIANSEGPVPRRMVIEEYPTYEETREVLRRHGIVK